MSKHPRLPFLLMLCLGGAPAHAERFLIDADNAGTIAGSGRNLGFDLSAVSGEIRAASLEIDINYSVARELDWHLTDVGGVNLPLAVMDDIAADVTMHGRYRINDSALTTWALVAPASGNLPTTRPARAFQRGQGGVCLNLLTRFLEVDINRAQPLTLGISRIESAQGNGLVSGARLIIDTGPIAEIFADAFEALGPATAPVSCQRPSFDVVLNGGAESPGRSTLTLIDYTGMPDWQIRHFDPPLDFPPIGFGVGSETRVYPGRFGGRSRMNIGFWDEDTGTLSFTTGAGVRSLALAGDWKSTSHIPIPGDYDGDGTTDLAMAFLGSIEGESRYVARIQFSASGALHDFIVDPRYFFPSRYNSAQIGFGAGQDAFRRGRDELTIYALDMTGNMRLMQVTFTPDGFGEAIFDGPSWGIPGDRMVLGNWLNGSSGNRFGLMVVRAQAGQWAWYLFPNATPTLFGVSGDFPLSIHVDHDALNDIAVYRPSDQMLHAIRSSDGQQVSLGPFGNVNSIPLGYLLGTTAPLPF